MADVNEYLAYQALSFLTGKSITRGDVTLWETELRAYLVSSYIAQARGLKRYYPYADKSSEVWNKGWKENKRAVKRIVGVYNYTSDKCSCGPGNPGPALSQIPLR